MKTLSLLNVIEEETAVNTIIQKIKDFFFAHDNYEHFAFTSKMTSLRIFITALLAGVFAFVVVFSLKKKTRKKFVDAVQKASAYTPETAKTLAELGISDDKSLIRILKTGDLSRMVSTAEGDEYNQKNFGENAEKNKMHAPPYRINPEVDRFYLAQEKAKSLASIYGGSLGTALTVVLALAVCIALWIVLDVTVPYFLSVIDARL